MSIPTPYPHLRYYNDVSDANAAHMQWVDSREAAGATELIPTSRAGLWVYRCTGYFCSRLTGNSGRRMVSLKDSLSIAPVHMFIISC